MSSPLPKVRALARQLFEAEGASGTGSGVAEAAAGVLSRLSGRISLLVGEGGFHLLLQRALKRARTEHPWLAAVHPEPGEPWRLAGLEEASRGAAPQEVAAGLETAVAELVGLIARFLGADMAVQLVRQSFPEIGSSGDIGSVLEEIIDE